MSGKADKAVKDLWAGVMRGPFRVPGTGFEFMVRPRAECGLRTFAAVDPRSMRKLTRYHLMTYDQLHDWVSSLEFAHDPPE